MKLFAELKANHLLRVSPNPNISNENASWNTQSLRKLVAGYSINSNEK